MKIIIQAGGKGTRLGCLTHNRPKCLVPVHNKPLIFHLFNKYPSSEFIIIGDYKFDVLQRYLNNFASGVNYHLIQAQGKGNICGIKQALQYIPEGEKFLLIWSDLILSENFHPECLSEGNYVGILKGSPCSWRFYNGKLENISSETDGVAGCFLFQNKNDLTNIPLTGSFTRWLANTRLSLKPMDMTHCLEVGTLDALKKFKDTLNRCRPYNYMQFTEDRVTKTGLTKEGKELIEHESLWYRHMASYGFQAIPKIYSFDPLIMQRIPGMNLFQAKLTEEQKNKITQRLIEIINQMHSYRRCTADTEDLIKEYYVKTINRLASVCHVIPFANQKYININGRRCKNPLLFQDDFKQIVQQNLMNTVFCPIHGDCTLTNIMLDEQQNIYFIDARGYFGRQIVVGDIRYDWAKLYYSMMGNFDRFNIKDFSLDITPDNITFSIASNGWEALATQVLDNMKDCKETDIKLIHAIIWLSLASHCWEDYDSMCLAFYNGVFLLETIYES